MLVGAIKKVQDFKADLFVDIQFKHEEGFRTLVESLVLMTHLQFTNFLEIS